MELISRFAQKLKKMDDQDRKNHHMNRDRDEPLSLHVASHVASHDHSIHQSPVSSLQSPVLSRITPNLLLLSHLHHWVTVTELTPSSQLSPTMTLSHYPVVVPVERTSIHAKTPIPASSASEFLFSAPFSSASLSFTPKVRKISFFSSYTRLRHKSNSFTFRKIISLPKFNRSLVLAK